MPTAGVSRHGGGAWRLLLRSIFVMMHLLLLA
jgi:hypothetical protein